MKKIAFVLFLLLVQNVASAQLEFARGFGGQLGLSFNLGTHFNRMGLMAKLYYHYEYVQANVQFCGYYNFRSFAIEKPSWEGQARMGIVAAFGPKMMRPNPFVHELSNQTGRAYSIGYSWNFYLDDVETSQMTATFGFGIWDFRMSVENDFLNFRSQDKYRTGVLSLFYRVNNTQFGLQHAAWTGDPYAEGTSRKYDKTYPSKYGYRDMTNAPYGNCSAGVLSATVEQSIGYGQYLGASIGIDAEQIRNFMQNELIHENIILKNPHIPMVDTEGKQYLHKDETQKIRTPLFFLQFLLNTGNFF